MGTRGFVGFEKDGIIKGFYNHHDSYYEYLGNKVLEKFEEYDEKTLHDFFTKRAAFLKYDPDDSVYENHREIWDYDWQADSIALQDGSDFLHDGLFCEYGYVFDLENDSVKVYRGFFKIPQFPNQKYHAGYDGKRYYTHNVFTITRENIPYVKELFNISYEEYDEKYGGKKYHEQAFLNDRVKNHA